MYKRQAAAQEDLDKRKAEWQNEKDAIVNVQELKSELEGAQLEDCLLYTSGYDPLQVANEGKMVCVVAPDEADAALAAMRANRYGCLLYTSRCV